MTDETPSRRQSDAKLDSLIAKVERAMFDREQHIKNYHAGMKPDDMEKMIVENQRLLGRIVDVLDGEDIIGLNGQVVDHKPGIRYQIEQITAHESNGGLRAKVKLSKGQWAAITGVLVLLTAIVNGVFTLLGGS